MPYQTELATALKDWGLSKYLIETNNWRTRGSSVFNPGGAVNHHTAGSRNNSIPSLKILIEGRADLSGPLCNVAQSRSSNFDVRAEFDQVYVVAAGRANHAGSGGFRGLVGNSSVFGLEVEHCGNLTLEGFSERRMHTSYIIHCAMAEVGGYDAEMVCQHKNWAPGRKIDFIGINNEHFQEGIKLNQVAHFYNMNNGLGGTGDDDEMWEWLVVFSYNDARGGGKFKADGSVAYDVRVSDPKGFRDWMVAIGKSPESKRFDMVNLLRATLRDKEGARISLY